MTAAEARNPMIMVMMSMVVMGTMGTMVQRSDDPKPLETVVQGLTSQLQTLQARMSALENTVQQFEVRGSQRVVFSASIGEPSLRAAPGHVIPFTHVITNVGQAYDVITSAFTAPYDGQYLLFVSVDVSAGYKAVHILRNGRGVIIGHNDVGDHHIVAVGAITLQAGDKVTVTHGPNSEGIVDGGPEAIFGGFKI